MNERQAEQWAARVEAVAAAFPYPPTPDVAAGVRRRLAAAPDRRTARRRRWAWAAVAAALVLVALAGLLAVPQVRAGVIEFLRLGGIRIRLTEPTPAATASPPPGGAAATPAPPRPTSTPLPSLLDLHGETTLEAARERAGLAIKLPAYPPDLGPPDRVYLQQLGGDAIVFLWLDPGGSGRPRLAMYELGPGVWGEKVEPEVIQHVTVNDQPALWVRGPYVLRLENGELDIVRIVNGYTLVWAEGEITYRLETDLPVEEAIKIAESLR